MSSEMRELIERVVEAAVALERVESSWCGDPNELEVPRRELEDAKSALLARTEAGADGAVAYRVRRGNGSWGIPHEYLPGSPATIAALCDEGCEVQYLHPQDASGDAERLNWLEAMANERGGLLLHDGSEAGRTGLGLRPGSLNRTLREAIDAAMQAKEAK